MKFINLLSNIPQYSGMLESFPEEFSSERSFPEGSFPKGQFPKSAVSQKCSFQEDRVPVSSKNMPPKHQKPSLWDTCHLRNYPSGKLSFWETVVLGNYLLVNEPSGKLSFWETSYWENSSGKLYCRKLPLGNLLTRSENLLIK